MGKTKPGFLFFQVSTPRGLYHTFAVDRGYALLLFKLQAFYPLLIIRQNAFNYFVKSGGMIHLKPMRKLMHDNVINNLGRIKHQAIREG